MTDQTEQTVNQIADGVVVAGEAIAPALGAPGVILATILQGIRALISLAEQLGHGDAIREALDAELAAGRQKTDEALAAKVYPKP